MTVARHGTERIVIVGDLSASHIGELAMGRAAVLLAGESVAVELRTISNHPDKARLIDERGVIVSGGQNLPGNWEGEGFNLARELTHRLPRLEDHEPVIVMHNDAVVQGLSEVPTSATGACSPSAPAWVTPASPTDQASASRLKADHLMSSPPSGAQRGRQC